MGEQGRVSRREDRSIYSKPGVRFANFDVASDVVR